MCMYQSFSCLNLPAFSGDGNYLQATHIKTIELYLAVNGLRLPQMCVMASMPSKQSL